MKRKLLLPLVLLILSTVAFSNERSRYNCRTAGNLPCPATTCNEPKATTCHEPTATASREAPASSNPASTEEAANNAGNHMFLHTLIKLLYI
jgi:hypothetical protein